MAVVLLVAPRSLQDNPQPVQPRELAEAWAAAAREQRSVVLVPDTNHDTIVLGPGAGAVAQGGPARCGRTVGRRLIGRRVSTAVAILYVSVMESVWDYPRPPSVSACSRRVRVQVARAWIADSTRALRVLETSHPPTIYVPRHDVRGELLRPSSARPTWCEFKGTARYLDAHVGRRLIRAVGWTYSDPAAGYEALRGHVAFYPGRVDGAWLDDERVLAQEGDFTAAGSPPT